MTIELGHANCNECEGGTRVLLIDERGIWSKCKRCGFQEFEWQNGDSLDYLVYLANLYHVSYAEIVEALENERRAKRTSYDWGLEWE